MTMPTWVADRLIHNGVMTQDRVTHTAKPRTCQTCHARILTGLDLLGHRTETDPTPISTLGELTAVLTGRTTYGLFSGELDPRDGPEITYRPANVRPVYAAHLCYAAPLPAETKFIHAVLSTPTADDQPPF